MKFQMPFNSRVHIRLFERVSTPDSECHRVFDVLGLEDVDGDVDAVTAGYASRFHRTRPVTEIQKDVDKANAKDSTTDDKSEGESKDTPPSDKTEDDTPVTPVDVVPSTEETPVDSEDEPEAPAPSDVETDHDVITRKGEEASEEEDDGTGQTFMD